MNANMPLVKELAEAILHIKYCKSGDAPCVPCGKAALLIAQALADSVFAAGSVAEISKIIAGLPRPLMPTPPGM
jgi:hypothetical protein